MIVDRPLLIIGTLMKLIALNLPRDLEQDAFETLFTAHGTVESCTLVMDEQTGLSKGFGFVVMAEEQDALNAIEALHGTKIKKFKIRVKPSTQE